MNLYSFSVKKPITILMITLVVIILGVVSLTRLPLDLLPKIEVPVAIVSTNYTGAGPQEIEKLITKPVEGAISTVGNVKNVTSVSSDGNSLVVAEFNFGTDMNFATLEMREKVDLVKGYLPKETKSPMVMKIDPNALPIIQLSLYGEEDISRMQSLLEEVIKPRIEKIQGVANVSLVGGVEKEVNILVDEGKLRNYGLTMERLSQMIGAENLNLPIGQVKKGNKNLTLKTVGKFKSLDELKKLPIPLTTGGVIYLRDVADISLQNKDMNTISRVNGKNSLSVSIQKQSGTNTVKISDKIKKELKNIQDDYPFMKMKLVLDQSKYIKQSIMNVFKNAIIGAILAIIVLYLFLKDLRTTLIISVSIPVSIVATFVLLYFGNITINIMTLGGLALGIGMLVDNSIVVLENIYRFNEQGLNSDEAAVKGAKEVSMAVIASTLTTIAVFLPVVFVEGMTATIFKELALTVTFSLLMSLLVSLTLIPMLSSKSLKRKKNKNKAVFKKTFGGIQTFYNKILRWALNHRAITIIIGLAVFVATITPLFLIGGEFFPPIDQGTFVINVSLPDGSNIEDTNEILTQIEKRISNIKEIDTIFSTVGTNLSTYSMNNNQSTNKGSITVILKQLEERERNTFEVADQIRKLREEIPGADISVDVSSDVMGELGGAPINISIKGDDLNVLKTVGDDFKDIVESVKGTREVKSSFGEGIPEIQIRLDRNISSQFGLSTFQVANAIRGSISGISSSKYKYEGTEIDISIKGNENSKNLSKLKSLPISTPLGTSILLGEIADITTERGPATINRQSQSRVISVTAQIINRDMESVIEDVQNKLKDYNVPYGIDYSFEGQHEQLQSAYKDLKLALILALVFVFIILASQFESFVHPFVIMLSVPLAFSGGSLGLLLTGKSLSVPAIVGAIILAGIVVNNAIVLVDYINTLRKNGMDRNEAVLKAGPVRLRPIFMTTLTTVLGLIPLAIVKGEGSEMQSPMAVTVIGGLLLSTLLTLVFIPVMYTLFDDLKNKIKKVN